MLALLFARSLFLIISLFLSLPVIGFCDLSSTQSGNSAILGGIGTGKIEILPDGRFGQITIQNNPTRPLNDPDGCFAAIAVTNQAATITKGLYRVPDDPNSVEKVTIRSVFPFVEADFADSSLPVTVKLNAFSPLILGKEDESCYPGIVLRYSVKNNSTNSLQVAVAMNWSNLIGLAGTGESYSPDGEISQKIVTRGSLSGIHYQFKPSVPSLQGKTVQGECALWYQAQEKESVSFLPLWFSEDNAQAFWTPLQQEGCFSSTKVKTAEQTVQGGKRPAASVAARQSIPAGEERQFVFLLTWSMPSRITADGNDWGNYYVNRWNSALQVADDLSKRWPEILQEIETWQNPILDSSLPRWFSERLCNSMACLAESGVFLKNGKFTFLTHDPRFPGNLGSPDERLVSLPFLLYCFPKLLESELNLFAACQLPDGEMPSAAGNLDLAIGTGDIPGGFIGRPDSSAAFILMVYEYFLWTGDTDFIGQMRPNLQAAMHWLENQDSNEDTIPDGPSLLPHNKKGVVSLFSADLWLAAMRVMEEIEILFRDMEIQTSAVRLRRQGAERLTTQLWNGNYFNSFFDAEFPDSPESSDLLDCLLPGEWYALYNGWNPFLKKEQIARAHQVINVAILNNEVSPGDSNEQYGFTSAFMTPSLCQSGYPEAAFTLARLQNGQQPALADTGLWPLYHALIGVGVDLQRRCLVVGPCIPAASEAMTVPFNSPHFAGTLSYKRTRLTGQQQCEITFDRATTGKAYTLEQVAFKLPLFEDSNTMTLTVLKNGTPVAGQDFSHESTRVFGFQPVYQPKEGDVLTLLVAPRDGPKIVIDLDRNDVQNLGTKCQIEKVSRPGQGVSFYAYNILRDRQLIRIEITNPGERNYAVFLNGEPRPLTIPTSEPVPVLLPQGHINREAYETLRQIQRASGEAAIQLVPISGKQELKKRLWKLQDDVNHLVERDALQRGIRLDIIPTGMADQTEVAKIEPSGEIADDLQRTLDVTQQFLNDLDKLSHDPVLASEITGLFVPVTIQVQIGKIDKESQTFNLEVRLQNPNRIPAMGRFSLELPEGWSAVAGSDVNFDDRQGTTAERAVQFMVTASGDLWERLYELDVVVSGTWNERAFRRKHTIAVGHNFIRKWLIVGPFPNRRGEGFDRMYPPELNLKTSETYDGLDKKVEWRELEVPEGPIDFNAALSPNERAAGYAYVAVYSPREQNVQFEFGCEGDIKLFHNYKEIFADRNLHDLRPGAKILYHKLYEGWNHLLIKLSHQTGAWGFYFEITGLQGLPLPDLRYALDRAE